MAAPIAIYTMGYSGTSVGGFLEACSRNGIKQILDVRNNPWSRKPGFSKKALSEHCRRARIEYLNIPELGAPRELRKDLAGPGSRMDLLDYYQNVILPERRPEIDRAIEYIRRAPTALVCLEADPAECHRSRLADELARVSGLTVEHLSALVSK